jgi:hypothetical protein
MRSQNLRAYTTDHVNRTSLTGASCSTKPTVPPTFAVICVARRIALAVTARVAQLASSGACCDGFPLNDPAELRAVVRLEATLVGSPPILARLTSLVMYQRESKSDEPTNHRDEPFRRLPHAAGAYEDIEGDSLPEGIWSRRSGTSS